MQAAHRVSLAKEYTAYAASLRTAVGTLGARYREALAQSPAHADLPWKQAEQMWQGAILQHWASLPADAPLSAYVLTHDTLRTIGKQLRRTVLRVREELTIGLAHSAQAGDTPAPGMLDKLKTLVELSRQANLNLGASNLPVAPPPQFIDAYPSGAVLRKWSEPIDAGAASGTLRKALDTAERIERQDDLKLQEAAIDAARGVIESLITTIEGGGKLRLASGTSLGVNTGTLSTGLQNARQALAIPVAIQADFHASHKRQAVVEIARGSHGRDLFVGTDKTVLAAAGFGASVGYDFKVLQNRIRAMVGASVVPIDVEKGERVGVMYRAVRQVTQAGGSHADWDTVKYDDTATREAMIALSNWLFQQATEHREQPPGADAVWNALAQHCSGAEADAISVGWVDQRKHRLRHKLRVGGGVNARVTVPATPVRVGVGARLTGEITSRDTTAMRETTGIMRAEQYSQGHGGYMTVRAGANYAVGKRFYTSPAQDAAAAGPTASVPSGGRHSITQGFNGGTPLTYTKQFAEHSHTAKLKTVHLDGRLADRVCYFDKEYKSAKEYLALIRSAQDTWIDMLSRRPGGTVEKARKEFEDYCATVAQHTGPHIRYLVRERLRPAAAREVEGHLDLANLHRATATGTPSGEADAPAMPEAGATAAPPARKTSHLPKPLRNLADKVTGRSQQAEARRMDTDAIRARLASGQPEQGRMLRALEREVEHRQRQAAARPRAEADAQACEAKADAVLFAETAWLPEKLAIVENVSKRESRGVSLTVQMQSTTEASGQRELSYLKFG
uniref:Type III effector, AWR3 n=1 Tax=Ralstonia solanacearum TaxID=305 RepID=A0A0S4TV52_RALSL